MSRYIKPLAGGLASLSLLYSATFVAHAQVRPEHALASLHVSVHVNPNPTHDGTGTTVTADTSPGARCSVMVIYPKGTMAKSAALNHVVVASNGTATWNWTPQTAKPGRAQAVVTCTKGQEHVTGAATFDIK